MATNAEAHLQSWVLSFDQLVRDLVVEDHHPILELPGMGFFDELLGSEEFFEQLDIDILETIAFLELCIFRLAIFDELLLGVIALPCLRNEEHTRRTEYSILN